MIILILFINCGEEKKGAHKLTWSGTQGGARRSGGRLSSAPEGSGPQSSQTHTLLSRGGGKEVADGAQATDLTSFSWPSRVVTHCEQ